MTQEQPPSEAAVLLSSPHAWLSAWLVPTLTTLLFGLFSFQAFTVPWPGFMQIVVVAVWAPLCLREWWYGARLLRASLNGRALLLEGRSRRELVSLDRIVSVKRNRWFERRLVELTLSDDTGFGRTIRFVTPSWFEAQPEEDAAARLSRLAAQSRHARPS